eukprot:1161568-Pelagomonas_calceolata.AAC.10
MHVSVLQLAAASLRLCLHSLLTETADTYRLQALCPQYANRITELLDRADDGQYASSGSPTLNQTNWAGHGYWGGKWLLSCLLGVGHQFLMAPVW